MFLRTVLLDAVVSSDDTNLSRSGGVSRAISHLAGPALSVDIARPPPLEIGDIAVTSGGDLPVKYILHAVTVDWVRGIRPTQRTFGQLVRNLFVRCEAWGIRRIALPALGAGAAGLSSALSAQLIFETLLRHVANPTVLEHVVFSDPGLTDDLDLRRLFTTAAILA